MVSSGGATMSPGSATPWLRAIALAWARPLQGKTLVKASLSALVPVFNAQATLAPLVIELLDVLADMTPRFDLVVIDNGSTDSTWEVAKELAVSYPQVKSVNQPGHWSRSDVVRTGLALASGEVMLLRAENGRLGPGCVPLLWQAIEINDLVLTRLADEAGVGRIPTLPRFSGTVREATEPDWQMVRRAALELWRREAEDEDWLTYLLSIDCRRQELTIPAREIAAGSRQSRAADAPGGARAGAARTAKRPNYLARLKALALGE